MCSEIGTTRKTPFRRHSWSWHNRLDRSGGKDEVANWLYGVARRLSLRARRKAAHRRELERRSLATLRSVEVATGPPPEPWPELYEELDRLPEPFRAALVLCDLEGNSYNRAAEMLHCPVGTLQSRLSRGRKRLRRRLEQPGTGFGSGPFGTWTTPPSERAVGAANPRTRGSPETPHPSSGENRSAGLHRSSVIGLVGSELRRTVLNRILAVVATFSVAALVVARRGHIDQWGYRTRTQKLRQATTNPSPGANTGPVHVRVVDARGQGVPGIAVDVTEFAADGLPQTLRTNDEGYIAIPREGIENPSGFDRPAWG